MVKSERPSEHGEAVCNKSNCSVFCAKEEDELDEIYKNALLLDLKLDAMASEFEAEREKWQNIRDQGYQMKEKGIKMTKPSSEMHSTFAEHYSNHDKHLSMMAEIESNLNEISVYLIHLGDTIRQIRIFITIVGVMLAIYFVFIYLFCYA